MLLRRPLACRPLIDLPSPDLIDQVKGMINHSRSLVPAKIIEIGQGRLKMAPRCHCPFRLLNAHSILLVGDRAPLRGPSPGNNRKIIVTRSVRAASETIRRQVARFGRSQKRIYQLLAGLIPKWTHLGLQALVLRFMCGRPPCP